MAGRPKRKKRYRIPQRIEILEQLVEKFINKLADPQDKDDKRWTKRWLGRLEREVARKHKMREHKKEN